MKEAPELSIIIPAKDEDESVSTLHQEIAIATEKLGISYEVIFVDDGSTDKTYEILRKISQKDKKTSVIRLRGNWGKSIALQVGIDYSRGDIVLTMDADGQDNPVDIPNFLHKIEEGYDLVVGWKKKRNDPITTVIPSRILNNFLIPLLAGIKLHDNNCGYKAFKREVAKNLSLYGELFRFIPILVAKQNFKVTEIIIHHRKRLHGKSKYGWQKNIKGLLDLMTIVFITGFIRRPGHFFGGIGLISFGFGFLIGLYITYLRITTGSIQYRQPLLILGLLLMMIGIQLITTGLMAELLTNFNQKRSSYEKYIKEIT